MKRSAPLAIGNSASVHCVSPEYEKVFAPSLMRSAVDGAPEKWITSALTTLSPSTSVGTPTGISVTPQGKRHLFFNERGKHASTKVLIRSVDPGGPAINKGRSRRVRNCPCSSRKGMPPK